MNVLTTSIPLECLLRPLRLPGLGGAAAKGLPSPADSRLPRGRGHRSSYNRVCESANPGGGSSGEVLATSSRPARIAVSVPGSWASSTTRGPPLTTTPLTGQKSGVTCLDAIINSNDVICSNHECSCYKQCTRRSFEDWRGAR